MSVAQNLNTLHLELLGWGVGSLILLWASLVYRRKGGLDALLWAVVLIDIGAHALYWFSGSFYIGPRYWFAMALPVMLLSALGYRALEERLTTAGAALGSVRMALALLLAFSVLVYVPWRGFEKYYGFGKSTAQIRAAEVPHNALVFYSGKVDPGSGVFLNLPFLPADRPVYLRSIDPAQDAAAAAAFPGRPVVHLEVTR